MTLFEEIKAAGIPFASHESDLYIPCTERTTAILQKYPLNAGNAVRFQNQVEGGTWYDVPFAYLPFWDKVSAKSKRATEQPA